jgi:inner membrane protein
VSPFNWTLVAERDDRYEVAHVNLRRQAPLTVAPDAGLIRRLDAAYVPVSAATWSSSYMKLGSDPATVAVAGDAWNDPDFAFFRWFSELPALYRVEPAGPAWATPASTGPEDDSRCVFFFDLRFLTPGRDTVPFRYGLCGVGTGSPTRWLLVGKTGRVPVP